MVPFHFCIAAWAITSRSVFCKFGELLHGDQLCLRVVPFMLSREDRMLLPRILMFLLKRHISYRCAVCSKYVKGMTQDTLMRIQHRISSKSLMYLCYVHQRAMLMGIPSFQKLPLRVVRRSRTVSRVCNFFRVVTKHRLGPFQQSLWKWICACK